MAPQESPRSAAGEPRRAHGAEKNTSTHPQPSEHRATTQHKRQSYPEQTRYSDLVTGGGLTQIRTLPGKNDNTDNQGYTEQPSRIQICLHQREREQQGRDPKSDPDPEGVRSEGGLQNINIRVIPLLIQWVLISTTILCAFTHTPALPTTLKPTMPSLNNYATLSSHSSHHVPPHLSPPSHTNTTIHHLRIPHCATPAPRITWPPSPPTQHHTTHTGVSKASCTYHTTNTATKESQKTDITLSKNLPPQIQIMLPIATETAP